MMAFKCMDGKIMSVYVVQNRKDFVIIGIYASFDLIPDEYTDDDMKYLIMYWAVATVKE